MFEMMVLARNSADYDLILYENEFKHAGDARRQPVHKVMIYSATVQSIISQIFEALQKSGYKPASLSSKHRGSFVMNRDIGIRLSLLFLLVSPLRRLDRIADISCQLSTMAIEEVCYWHSKCVSKEQGNRALRALRILLAG